jgi:hypothetical protein
MKKFAMICLIGMFAFNAMSCTKKKTPYGGKNKSNYKCFDNKNCDDAGRCNRGGCDDGCKKGKW